MNELNALMRQMERIARPIFEQAERHGEMIRQAERIARPILEQAERHGEMIRQAERIIRPIIEAHERIRPLLEAHNRMMEICLPHTVEPPKYVVVQSVEYPDSRLQHEKQDGRKQRRIGFRLPDEPEPDDDEFQEHPPERRRIGF